ncbi:hypothetical protein ACTNDG_01815 [Clostridium sp. HCP1S3_B4]|uniref:hypothetical protein n=1 Tax=unclassified Clostridium TaxID=2614128 RepID=UPI002A7881B4|nr:hypothetical protein [Clostridiales bacterium]MDY2729289.1 hypothetical protein [Clostridium sp.]
MEVKMSMGILVAVFLVYMVITALVIFLSLFRKGKLISNPILFALTQSYTVIHTVLRFTTTGIHVNEIIGKGFAVILAIGAFVCAYLNIKKNPWAGRISTILIVLSVINVWIL